MKHIIRNITILKIVGVLLFTVTSLAIKATTFESHSVSGINKKYELVYFYSHSCKYCHAFTPILAKYAKDNRINISGFVLGESVSSTNQPTVNLPGNINADQEIIEKFFGSVDAVIAPALFLLDKSNLHVYPVSQGALGYQELVSRIKQLQQQI